MGSVAEFGTYREKMVSRNRAIARENVNLCQPHSWKSHKQPPNSSLFEQIRA
jgi:hypothetical protein